MLPTKRLILALRETAQRLRQPDTDYNWWWSERCNCGQLAISLGMQKDEINAIGSWTIRSQQLCSETHQPIIEVFNFLFTCGLEPIDIPLIEHCGGSANRVAQWMDQKADELERRRVTEKESERL